MNQSLINSLRDLHFSKIENDLIRELDPQSSRKLKLLKKEVKNFFRILEVIARSGMNKKKIASISESDLMQLYFYFTDKSEDSELFNDELIHYNRRAAMRLQPQLFDSIMENSYLLKEEAAWLIMIFYERLFAYDLSEVYENLVSMNPEEDDIDDYSNSTIEVYDSTDFSDYDGEFQSFIHEMIACFERNGFTNSEELELEN